MDDQLRIHSVAEHLFEASDTPSFSAHARGQLERVADRPPDLLGIIAARDRLVDGGAQRRQPEIRGHAARVARAELRFHPRPEVSKSHASSLRTCQDHAVVASPELWYSMPALQGRKIRLEPLTLEHAPGYLKAVGLEDEAADVFRWLNPAGAGATPYPVTPAEAARQIAAALAARARGERLPYAQIDSATGEFAGTTSLYEVLPATRTMAIGHTWLGRRWWRTGLNTESKLLLLTYAFDALGAVRVVWHTDVRNERSQAAIARLGAVREGVLRKHRLRHDGSWRDTVQFAMTDDDWPQARERLANRLRS